MHNKDFLVKKITKRKGKEELSEYRIRVVVIFRLSFTFKAIRVRLPSFLPIKHIKLSGLVVPTVKEEAVRIKQIPGYQRNNNFY